MEDKYLNIKKEIEKINQRVKEYLWTERYLFEIKSLRCKNARNWLLARQNKFTKNN